MKSILKRKLLTSIIIILNIGFLILAADTNSTEGTHDNILFALTNTLIIIGGFSLIYVAPMIIFIGVPISIMIEKILKVSKYKNFKSFALYIVMGLAVGIITLNLFDSDLLTHEKLTNDFYLIKFMFLCVYPSISFWFIDLLIEKVKYPAYRE